MENFQMFNLDSEEAEEPEIKLPTSVATAAKSLQSCLTLCDPIDGSPPGSLIPGILQARTLEWVAISFSSNLPAAAAAAAAAKARTLEWVAI